MREIKFRAWINPIKEDDETVYTGMMVDVKKIDYSANSIAYIGRNSYLPAFGSYDWVNFKNIELMQYTGLKDGKRTKEYPEGQEIYEGDIVKRYDGLIAVILFDCSWYTEWQNKYKSRFTLQGSNHTFEVIGNIYENPELMEG